MVFEKVSALSLDMEALMRAVECVSAFFLIGYLGYWLSGKGWFSDESATMLSRLVTSVVIPITLVYTINVSTTKDSFLPLLPYIFIPCASILITMLVTALLIKTIDMVPTHRNIVIAASACSNTINIGLPVNLALFGPESLPAILVYYMGNTIVFWSVGNFLLASDARDVEKAPIISVKTGKRMLSPPIIAFFIGLALLVLDLKIPSVLTLAGKQIAGMLTPLAIICIGIAMWRTGIRNIRFSRDVGIIALGRFVVSPLVLLAIVHFFPVSPIMRDVFIIQCTLPPMANIALLAIRYKSDPGFASVAISLCTLCALFTVPLFMLLL